MTFDGDGDGLGDGGGDGDGDGRKRRKHGGGVREGSGASAPDRSREGAENGGRGREGAAASDSADITGDGGNEFARKYQVTLRILKYYHYWPDGRDDTKFKNAIETFQRDMGMPVDGHIRSGGPTGQGINAALEYQRVAQMYDRVRDTEQDTAFRADVLTAQRNVLRYCPRFFQSDFYREHVAFHNPPHFNAQGEQVAADYNPITPEIIREAQAANTITTTDARPPVLARLKNQESLAMSASS